MPTEVAGIPLLPLIALLGGIIVLIKADVLNWVVAIFLIGYGALGLLVHFDVIEKGEVDSAVERVIPAEPN